MISKLFSSLQKRWKMYKNTVPWTIIWCLKKIICQSSTEMSRKKVKNTSVVEELWRIGTSDMSCVKFTKNSFNFKKRQKFCIISFSISVLLWNEPTHFTSKLVDFWDSSERLLWLDVQLSENEILPSRNEHKSVRYYMLDVKAVCESDKDEMGQSSCCFQFTSFKD